MKPEPLDIVKTALPNLLPVVCGITFLGCMVAIGIMLATRAPI